LPNPQSPEADVMGEELWYVKLGNGDVHRVTIDQLDGAFQAGHIDENTMVLAAGASQWTKLGEIAGLDDDSSSDAQTSSAEGAAAEAQGPEVPVHQEEEELAYIPQVQAAPAAASADQDEVLDYVPQRPPPAYVQQAKPAPAPVAEAPAGYIPQRPPPAYVQQVAARVAAAPLSQAPSYAPPAQGTPYAVAIQGKPPALAAAPYVPNSLRPMSMDLDFDDVQFPRKSRTGRFVAAVIGLAAIAGGVGFAAQRAHFPTSSSDLSSVAAAAAVAAPPPVTEPAPPPPAPAPPPPVVASPSPSPAAAPAGASPMNPQFTSRFNEDTAKKLVAADKARETKAKARHSGGGGGSTSTPRSKSTNFTTGGNKFDPLNSSI
jgi:hypothetical protein